ncbi:clotting factor B-like [Parasteatoda tepidariorum]|uniref:clotting factor B-like n=1 Tax=Parasteatoda tepidariorum TaxID=114398 RepID=UPI00077FB207|nr:proclotting enzyme-like [Parasteatoda tepidariorum]
MEQIILILILNVMILPCHLACAEATFPEIECGTNTLPGGGRTWAETSVSKYPWVASIYFKDPSANEQAKLYGTASIVTAKHLITVAKVVTSSDTYYSDTSLANFFAVVGGEYGKDGILYDIQNIYKYFLINHPILGGGLAIAEVVNKIIFTDKIRPACLPGIQSYSHNQQQNQSLPVVGWHSVNSSETSVLYEIDVQIQPEDFCQQFVNGTYPSDELICGICSDQTTSKLKFGNGGPLMSSINGKTTVIGVTDSEIGYELPNENTDVPLYFLTTDFYNHMEWIRSIIQPPTE